MKEILFDFDVVVYRAAFAHQKTIYEVNGERFDKKSAEELYRTEGCPIFKFVETAPIEYALATVKNIIGYVQKELNISEYRGYLTDNDNEPNFRMLIKGNKPYKANRKELIKPVHYDTIREYLINHQPTTMVSGQEADDALGIEQSRRGLDTVIASIDKDLLQVPGNHFNLMTGDYIRATDPGTLELSKNGKTTKLMGVGFKWFCAQMLLGDTVDNIVGLGGYGPVLTHKTLKSIYGVRELWDSVVRLYEASGKTEEQLWGTANLLWIRREENQTFNESVIKDLQIKF